MQLKLLMGMTHKPRILKSCPCDKKASTYATRSIKYTSILKDPCPQIPCHFPASNVRK